MGGWSTLSQLLKQHDYVLRMLEDGDNLDVVYLDFEKAFNKVDHPLLLRKIRALGITGDLEGGDWGASWLTEGRPQRWRAGSRAGHTSSRGSPRARSSDRSCSLSSSQTCYSPTWVSYPKIRGRRQNGSLIIKYVDDTKILQRFQGCGDVASLQADLTTRAPGTCHTCNIH